MLLFLVALQISLYLGPTNIDLRAPVKKGETATMPFFCFIFGDCVRAFAYRIGGTALFLFAKLSYTRFHVHQRHVCIVVWS